MQQTELKQSSNNIENNQNKIQQLWFMQSEIKRKIDNQQIQQKSILLIGDTNVGKTTLLYYLSGMKLNLVENIAKKTKQMEPQTVYLDAKVSNSQSTTQVPNIFSQINEMSEISHIDMPGINDKRFMNTISNMFTFSQVFEKLTKVTKIHIVLVISQEIFDVQQIKENLQQFVCRFNVQTIKKANNLSIIFTKTEDDQQSVKEQFIEFIQQIRQELQDDEDQKDVVKIIDLIKQLNENQQIIYIFPKQDPNQDSGLKITKSILQRDAFIDIGQSILHELFIENVLTSQKMKISSFQDNLIETIQQSYDQIYQFVDLSIGLARFLHKKFASQIFESETDFKTQLQSFYTKFKSYIIQSKQIVDTDGQQSFQQFQQSMNFICDNISQTREIYLLSRSFKQLLTHNQSNQQQNDKQKNRHNNLGSQMSTLLKKFFDKISDILSNFKESQIFIISIRQICNLLSWMSQKWFTRLGKIKSLEKIKTLLQKSNQQLQKQIAQKWIKISDQKPFSSVLNKFGEKINEIQQGSESQQEQQNKVQQTVQDNGYYGRTLKQLKQKYMKVDIIPKLDESKASAQMSLKQQAQIQQKIRKIVSILENQIITQVKKAQESGQFKVSLHPERIAFILFQMRNLRHKIFLQSAMKNFSFYLKFIYYSLVQKSERQKILDILRGFVKNLCVILDQYSLFEEEILLMLFVHGYNNVCKVFERGIRIGRIGQEFIKTQLIGNLKVLIDNTQCAIDLQQISEIVMTVYNYLIAEYCSSRSESIQYQNEMNLMLNQIEGKKRNFSNLAYRGSSNQTQSKNQCVHTKQPNYFILVSNPYFQFDTVAYKVDILQKRNTSLQTYQIFHHFHKNFINSIQLQQKSEKQRNIQSVTSN